jgi:hypothetical protein
MEEGSAVDGIKPPMGSTTPQRKVFAQPDLIIASKMAIP